MKEWTQVRLIHIIGAFAILAIATWLGLDPPWAEPSAIRQRAFVEKIVDGDTIKVRLVGSGESMTVRILGIDCPESHKNKKCKRDEEHGRKGCEWQIPRGLLAAKRAAELLKHKTVVLECDEECKKGSFGRELRYVRIPDTQADRDLDPEKIERGLDFGLQMIKEGYCEDYSWKYYHPRAIVYKRAKREAKRKKIGIWKDD